MAIDKTLIAPVAVEVVNDGPGFYTYFPDYNATVVFPDISENTSKYKIFGMEDKKDVAPIEEQFAMEVYSVKVARQLLVNLAKLAWYMKPEVKLIGLDSAEDDWPILVGSEVPPYGVFLTNLYKKLYVLDINDLDKTRVLNSKHMRKD